MKKHKLIIKSKGSQQSINSLKIKHLKEYLPTTEELVGHMEFQKLKAKQGLEVSPLEVTVPEKYKQGIREELTRKGYKGVPDEVAMFATHTNTVPICVLFL